MPLLVYLLLSSVSVTLVVNAGFCSQYYQCNKVCYQSKSYNVSCGWHGWGRCTRYRQFPVKCIQTCKLEDCCSGYIGADCATPLCVGSITCPNNGTCSAPDSCVCQDGYASPNCTDIDECEEGTHNCTHKCQNTQGSYQCGCYQGYLLESDMKTCTDIDECQTGNHKCKQNCRNTPGSYDCFCDQGYSLGKDKETCFDIDECKNISHGCNQRCQNTPGSYLCTCYRGYYLDSDNKTCNDIKECERSDHGCQQSCRETPGSYVCDCELGYTLDEDKRSCNDVNEHESVANLDSR